MSASSISASLDTDAGVRRYASDIAFTPVVKEIQVRKGSRGAYERMEQAHSWATALNEDIAAFVMAQTSAFLATANADGQPYIQHRGGPPGFLHVLDARTIAFADFRGNRQYITLGNLAENFKACLFLVDYMLRRRVKLWGTASVVENDDELLSALMPEQYKARPEQAIVFRIAAWDENCSQHIPQRFEAADVAAALAKRDRHIAKLEAEIARLSAKG